MTVARKIILVPFAVGSALILSLLATWYSSHRTQRLFQEADQEARSRLASTVLAMKSEQMEKVIRDYTYWTELYRFVAAPRPGWAEANLDSVVDSFSIDLMLLYNRRFEPVHHATNSNCRTALPEFPRAALVSVAEKRLHHFFLQTGDGLLEIHGGSIHPSDDPERKSAPGGLLLLGRLWDDAHLAELAALIRLELRLVDPPGENVADEAVGMITRHPLTDWQGNRLAVLEMRGENPHYQALVETERWFLALLAFFSIGVLLTLIAAIRRWIGRPLSLLRRSLETEEVALLPGLARIGPEYRDLAVRLGEHFIQRRRLERETELRRRITRNLAASQARYRSLFEKMVDGFLHCEAVEDGYRIIEANPSCTALLGRLPEELQGMALADALPWVRPAGADFARIAGDRPFVCETADARHLRISGYRPEQGQLVLLLEDMTGEIQAEQARRTLEAQLIQAQKLESIGTMAGGVAHEINNPLMSIINLAQLIEDRVRIKRYDLDDLCNEIISEGQRIAKIVRSLLAFSRQETERFSTVRIEEMVTAALRLIGNTLEQEDIRVASEIPTDLPTIQCDRQQIEQVLINLLLNARYALNEKYGFTYHEEKAITISATAVTRNGREYVRLEVYDKGTGVDPEIRAKLFDPFFTTKPSEKGTGLGLSISYGIIKRHGGTISVESETGQFSRFRVEIPVTQEDSTEG